MSNRVDNGSQPCANDRARVRKADDVEALALRFRAGDETAFDELVRRMQHPVFNLAYRMLNDYEEASDAAQEIFVKVYRSIRRFRGASRFSTWLFAIAINVCRSRLRWTQRRHAVEIREVDPPQGGNNEPADPADRDPVASPDQCVQRAELAMAVQQAIATLPPDFAAVIVLRDIQDTSYEEIARRLGCGLGTVKSRLFRARAMLKERLQRRLPELGTL